MSIRQTPRAKYVTVHPTGMIEAEGVTEGGKRISLYIVGGELDLLRQTFLFAEAMGFGKDDLGHAFWHVRNQVEAKGCLCCEQIAKEIAAKRERDAAAHNAVLDSIDTLKEERA